MEAYGVGYHSVYFKRFARKLWIGDGFQAANEKGKAPFIDVENRVIRYVMTEEVRDRAAMNSKGRPAGDVIRVKGMDLSDFGGRTKEDRNPVMTAFHDYSDFPIGHWEDLTKHVDGPVPRLVGDAHYSPEGIYSRADIAFALAVARDMRAVSIGFIDTKSEEIKDPEDEPTEGWYKPRDFKKSYLLETAAVAIPMNQNALATGKGVEEDFLDLAKDMVSVNRRAGLSPDRVKSLLLALVEKLTIDAESDDGGEPPAPLDRPAPEPKPEGERKIVPLTASQVSELAKMTRSRIAAKYQLTGDIR